MVEASCRLIDSAVRHHNRLEAAAVSRIAANTSAETTNRMLTVSVLADGGRSRAKAFRGGTAFMLASAGLRRRLKAIRRARAVVTSSRLVAIIRVNVGCHQCPSSLV